MSLALLPLTSAVVIEPVTDFVSGDGLVNVSVIDWVYSADSITVNTDYVDFVNLSCNTFGIGTINFTVAGDFVLDSLYPCGSFFTAHEILNGASVNDFGIYGVSEYNVSLPVDFTDSLYQINTSGLGFVDFKNITDGDSSTYASSFSIPSSDNVNVWYNYFPIPVTRGFYVENVSHTYQTLLVGSGTVTGTVYIDYLDSVGSWNNVGSHVYKVDAKTDYSYDVQEVVYGIRSRMTYSFTSVVGTFEVRFYELGINGYSFEQFYDTTATGSIQQELSPNNYNVSYYFPSQYFNVTNNINFSSLYDYDYDEVFDTNVSLYNNLYSSVVSSSCYYDGYTSPSASEHHFVTSGVNQELYCSGDGYDGELLNTSFITSYPYSFVYNMTRVPVLNISVRQESDNSLVLEPVTVSLVSSNSSYVNITSLGLLYLDGLEANNYTVTFSSANYTSRIYNLGLEPTTYQELTAYLVPSDSPNTIFTFQDKDNSALLEGVILSIETLVNGSWVVVSVLSSDITGKIQFDYVEGSAYRFTTSYTNYEVKSWSLSPILFTSYIIKLSKGVVEDDAGAYSGVAISLSPSTYYNGAVNNISLVFANPSGSFTGYGFNATFNSEFVQSGGSSVYGGTETASLSVINASLNDVVILRYYYNLADGTHHEFTKTYSLAVDSDGNWLTNMKEDYGLGLFERLMIMAVITLLVAGFVTIFSNEIAGGVTAMFIWGFFVWTGFVSYWIVIPSLVFLTIVVMWRSSR